VKEELRLVPRERERNGTLDRQTSCDSRGDPARCIFSALASAFFPRPGFPRTLAATLIRRRKTVKHSRRSSKAQFEDAEFERSLVRYLPLFPFLPSFRDELTFSPAAIRPCEFFATSRSARSPPPPLPSLIACLRVPFRDFIKSRLFALPAARVSPLRTGRNYHHFPFFYIQDCPSSPPSFVCRRNRANSLLLSPSFPGRTCSLHSQTLSITASPPTSHPTPSPSSTPPPSSAGSSPTGSPTLTVLSRSSHPTATSAEC
jgi:hypothetical protein